MKQFDELFLHRSTITADGILSAMEGAAQLTVFMKRNIQQIAALVRKLSIRMTNDRIVLVIIFWPIQNRTQETTKTVKRIKIQQA